MGLTRPLTAGGGGGGGGGDFLPLAGGTMDAGADINFANASRLREGLTDAGNGGAGGVALVCSLDYEFKWEAGRLYVMGQDGFTIRVEQYGFTNVPTATDDDTKGYIIGSRRILDDGAVYLCIDATEDAAVWVAEGFTTAGAAAYFPQGIVLEDGYSVNNAYDVFATNGFFGGDSTTPIAAPFPSGFDAGSCSGVVGSLLTGYDFTTAISVDNRQLVGDNGVPQVGWGNSGLNFGYDGFSSFYNTLDGTGINTPHGLVVDLVYKQLSSSTSFISVDWGNRFLYANDGFTVAADWSTGAPSFPQGATIASNLAVTSISNDTIIGPPAFTYGATLTPTAVTSLVGNEGTIAYVNDADTPAIGSAVAGGASAKCLVCYNGTSWIVTSLL